MFRYCFVFIIWCSTVSSLGLEVLEEEQEFDFENDERLIIVPATINFTALFGDPTKILAFSALATSLFTLAALTAVSAVLFSLIGKYKHNDYYGYGGIGDYSGYDTGSSYSSYRSLFDPTRIDWENISILDIIEVLEDMYTNFQPSDLNCQKRFICELHQNTKQFGPVASKLVDLFKYLKYAEVMAFPEELESMILDLNDAARVGSKLKKDCGKIYDTCKFSVKEIADKYHPNNV